MSYNNNNRDPSRRRSSRSSMELLAEIEKEWNESQSNSPATYTPTSTHPSSPASPHISTPASARVVTPASATASSTSYPRSVPNPPRRSVTSAPMYETQSPVQGPASGENSDFEVRLLHVRPKLTRINTSPDIAGHTPVEDSGHSMSPHPSDTRGGSYTNTPMSSYNTYNGTHHSATHTPTYSSPGDPYPDSPSDSRYIPTPMGETLSDISQNEQPPATPSYSDVTPESEDSPPRSPRWRDGREVPEERLEHDFDRETPQVVLDAEEAANTRERPEGTLSEMRKLTRLATMMELFFTAENALTAEDEDRAEWKIREGLTIAQELGETEYIQRAEIMMKAAADLGRQKVQEAYERAHSVTYVADGAEESESESESDSDSDSGDEGDDEGDDDQDDIDGEDLPNSREGRPEVFGDSEDDAGSEGEGDRRASKNAAVYPLFQNAGRFQHPHSSNTGKVGRSPTTTERRDRYRHPADNGEQSGAFPTDTPPKSREKKCRSSNRGPRRQYVKPKPVVLPATFQSWEACSEDEETDPLSRHFIKRKRGREEYSETNIWSHLLLLKPVSAARSKLPKLRKRALSLLPQTWYTPDGNGDTDQPPPPGGFLSVYWWTHGLSLLLQMLAPGDNDWQAKYESSAFKPGRAEFTFRAHIPCSWMAPRSRPTELFPEQPCEHLVDEEKVKEWKKDVGEAKLDMAYLYWERAQFLNATQLKKEGRLAPTQKKAQEQKSRFPVFDFSLISWVKLFILLFFLYWFCFGIWRAGLLTRIHIPVWNPLDMVNTSRLSRLEDYLPEPLRLG